MSKRTDFTADATRVAVLEGDTSRRVRQVPFEGFDAEAKRFARTFRRGAMLIFIGCAVLQVLIDSSPGNLAATVIALMASILTFRVVVVGSVFRVAPIPAFSVLSFNIAAISGPLVAQSAALTPISFNLQNPTLTFGCLALMQLTLLIAFLCFRKFRVWQAIANVVRRMVVEKLGLFRFPTDFELWGMGGIGSAALIWTATVMYGEGIQYGDAGGKFIFGLTSFAYMPYLIPLRGMLTAGYSVGAMTKRAKIGIVAYTAAMVILGMLRNSRGTFATGCVTLLLMVFIAMLVGQLRLTAKIKRQLLGGALVLLMIAPVMSDMAIAMVIARTDRGSVSTDAMLKNTWQVFTDRGALDEYKSAALQTDFKDGYDERYLENPFFSRFILTKFSDNVLSYDTTWSGTRRGELWGATVDKVLSLLPTPALRIIGQDIDKNDLDYSIGDYMYYTETGVGLGGHRLGSSVGHGVGLFGLACFVIFIPPMIAVFICLQAFSTIRNSIVVVSPIIAVEILKIYYIFVGDSVLEPITLFVREIPQFTLIYIAVSLVLRVMRGISMGR